METNYSKMSYVNVSDPHKISSIKRIEHYVLSNSNTVISSAISARAGLTSPELYNGTERTQMGAHDLHLGTTEAHEDCKTCGEGYKNCISHEGHIKLAEPVYNFAYMRFVRNIGASICLYCGKLLVPRKTPKEIAKMLKRQSLQKIYLDRQKEIKKINDCPHCGKPVMKLVIKKEAETINIVAEPNRRSVPEEDIRLGNKILQQNLAAGLLQKQFANLSNADCFTLGLNPYKSHPKDMIISDLPVAAAATRPSVKLEIKNVSMMDDGLTYTYVRIIKSNEELKNKRGDGTLSRTILDQPDYQNLQCAVIQIFDSSAVTCKTTQKSADQNKTKSIKQRHKGKEGRWRNNASGKRTDQSSRAVITSDPKVSTNYVGCPLMIARILSFPEYVTKQNYDMMVKLVQNGSTKYPGATKHETFKANEDGSVTSKSCYIRKGYNDKIKIGDIIHRNLIKDPVIFNRQPSLHKLSMMGHFVQVITNPQFRTFRVNVGVTEPYNADFDGDEMNLHVPQSLITQAEVVILCNSGNRMISPKDSAVIIAIKQDALAGLRMITGPDIWIDWKDCMDFMMVTTKRLTGSIPKNSKVSGKYLFSQIIPDRVNVLEKNSAGKIEFRINNGIILDGHFSSGKSKTLIQKIWFTCGATDTRNYLDNAQMGLLNWMTKYGFTIGIKDLIMPNELLESIYKVINSRLTAVESKITEYENNPYMMRMDVFETQITLMLNTINNSYEAKLKSNLHPGNGLETCINSGSNGKMDNVTQIIGCVGQADFEGGRIPKRYADNRILPYFAQHDDRAESRGYCVGSFFRGLGPAEFYCHIINGRTGIINTAVRTARTGYLQRRMIKIMEDVRIFYDHTVRNANEKVIKFVYGGNGVSSERQVEQRINIVHMNNEEVRDQLCYSDKELKEVDVDKAFNEGFYKKVIGLRNKLRSIQSKISLINGSLIDKYMMPVDIQQRIIDIENQTNRKNSKIVSASYVASKLKEMYSDYDFRINLCDEVDDNINKTMLKIYLFETIPPKKCTHTYKFSKDEFDFIFSYYRKAFMLSLVEPGEMVGLVSAQSVGEPVTQMTLKSFQKTGIGKSVTSGLPRFEEILSVTQNIKTQSMSIYMKPEYEKNHALVSRIAANIRYTKFKDIIVSASIVHDPNPKKKTSLMNRDEAVSIYEYNDTRSGCQSDVDDLPWVLRIKLSREKMVERKVSLLDVQTSFCINWATKFDDAKSLKKDIKYRKIMEKIIRVGITTNFDNSPVPIAHIRFNAINYNWPDLVKFLDYVIDKFSIKGIPGITETTVSKNPETYIDFDKDGNKMNKERYVITTEGINIGEIAQVNGVDNSMTTFNDIVAYYHKYGIEAYRHALILEFKRTIEEGGASTNFQHVEILGDNMCHLGSPLAVNRHGANRMDTDVLARATFEEPIDHMINAAVFNQIDYVRSFSSKIVVGELMNGGTGAFDLLLNAEKIASFKPKPKNVSSTKRKSKVTGITKKK